MVSIARCFVVMAVGFVVARLARDSCAVSGNSVIFNDNFGNFGRTLRNVIFLGLRENSRFRDGE